MSSKGQKKFELSGIKGMWLFTLFDLPVDDNRKKREYMRFRNALLDEGFSMLQYSVYARYCDSREKSLVFQKKIKRFLPSGGQVRLIHITDKQFGEMTVFYGRKKKKPEEKPEQLLLL